MTSIYRRGRAACATAFVVGLALCAPFAQAQDEGPDERQVVVRGEKEKAKKVCRIEKKIGSNLPRKVCRTVSDDLSDGQNLDDLRDMQNAREGQQRAQVLGGGIN